MTTMINRTNKTATGGPSSPPVITISMYEMVEDGFVIDHMELIPTIDRDDAEREFNSIVEKMAESFTDVEPVYAPIRIGAEDYRRVTFAHPNGTILAVERFSPSV